MKNLILVRHGQSVWNLSNRFTGWIDVELTEEGKKEAEKSGELIKNLNIPIVKYFSSPQKRAYETLSLILKRLGNDNTHIIKAWQLNERHYGKLTSLNKKDTEDKYGKAQVFKWRRSWNISPPAMEEDDLNYKKIINSYPDIPKDKFPKSESLQETYNRVIPYFDKTIYPTVEKNHVIISAHGNSLRALYKKIFNISDSNIVNLNIPTGNPLLIEFKNISEVKQFRYLDETRSEKIL